VCHNDQSSPGAGGGNGVTIMGMSLLFRRTGKFQNYCDDC
jgi:hypothetical protein